MEDDSPEKQDRYHQQRQAALAWLGDRYLLATPINRRDRGNSSNDQEAGQGTDD